MIDAREAYKKSSESYDFIAEEKFQEFKKEAERLISRAVELGRWYCSIHCDNRAVGLAMKWLRTYGYLVKSDSETIFVDWSECE